MDDSVLNHSRASGSWESVPLLCNPHATNSSSSSGTSGPDPKQHLKGRKTTRHPPPKATQIDSAAASHRAHGALQRQSESAMTVSIHHSDQVSAPVKTYGSIDKPKAPEKARNNLEHGRRQSDADALLDVLGYQSELTRSRSTWTVAFMSFVLASVPYGLSTTLYYPLVGGGPVCIIWGWLGVGLIVMCLAISLGEITSVYPTSGGVYYQTFMLAPRSYRNIMAWICGWAYFLGNLMITLSVNFGTTLFLIGCINIFTDSTGNGIFPPKDYHYYSIFLAITLLCNTISSLGNKYLPLLDTFAIFWTLLAISAITLSTLLIAHSGRHTPTFVFTSFTPSSNWPPGWSFLIGLLHAAYATSATGMILSMCEEVHQPATQVPLAMTGALALNILAGLIFLIPLVFVIPSITTILSSPYAQPLPIILSSATGSQTGAFALTLPITILGILCGTSCTTASSRCTWAFARDGALPGSRLWRKINTHLNIPLNALLLIMVIELMLGLIYFASSAAFNAFSGCGVIFLTLAYTLPIIMSVFERRQSLKLGHYDFKWFGWICNIIAIAWSVLVVPLFSMPAILPVTAGTMNYASVVFVGGMTISGLWYWVWGRKHYEGPPTKDQEEVFRRRRSSFVGG